MPVSAFGEVGGDDAGLDAVGLLELLLEFVEAVFAAGRGDDAMAALDEGTSDGGAESCGRTGDEHDHYSSLVGRRQRPQAYFQCGAAARIGEPDGLRCETSAHASWRAFAGRLCAVFRALGCRRASALRDGGNLVAYSILFQ